MLLHHNPFFLPLKRISFLLCVLLTVSSCDGNKALSKTDVEATPAHKPTTEKEQSKVVAAYFFGQDVKALRQYPLDKITHVIFSFLHLNGDRLAFDNEKDKATVKALVALKQEYPHLKVLVALGGWGGCETCSEVFSREMGREHFAHSVKRIIEETGIDGLDLDWEYPVVEGYPGHQHLPEDKDNFTALVKRLREVTGDATLLTFAAGGYGEFLERAIDWPSVVRYVDWVNVMSYDLVNGYSKVTGHHTPLYASKAQPESTDNAVQYLINAGVPAEQIVIGSAFYARIWENVAATNEGLFQANATFKHTVDYRTLAQHFTTLGFVEHWDEKSQAPYAYSQEARQFATYDNTRSVRAKVQYVQQQQLRGIMFWHIGADKTEGGLLDMIDAALHDAEHAR